MKPARGAAAFRRIASFLIALGALLGVVSAAQAQVTMDTRPAQPNVGDYVTLNIAGAFPREDFWVTEVVVFDLYRKPGTSNDYIADVDLFYHWSPRYDGPEVRTPFNTSVGLGYFNAPGTVEVRLRAFPQPGVPLFYDPTDPVTTTFSVGSGTRVCGNELVIGGSEGTTCTPTLRFGSYAPGEASNVIPLVIRNGSRAPVYLGPFEVNNDDYGMTRLCQDALEPGDWCEVRIRYYPSIDGNSPGRLTIRYAGDPHAIPFLVANVALSGETRARPFVEPASGLRIVEYHAESVDQYFITGNENEMRALDAAGSGWKRTGLTFMAAGSHSVCRFYGDPVAGPRGHFYTARVDQCDALRLQDQISPRGRSVYRYEGLAFTIGLPLIVNDDRWRCPDFSRPIYQFRRPAGNGRDVAYRLVPAGRVAGGINGDDLARTLLQSGWSYDGHVMCSAVPEPVAQ